MENASDALIMAGGILIGILILSLAVYLFASFGTTAKEMNDQIDEHRLVEYNAQYTIYNNPDIDITIYDIVTVANLAKQNNENYQYYGDYENEYKVSIIFIPPKLKGFSKENEFQDVPIGDMQEKYISKLNEVDKNNGNMKYKFKCTRHNLS